MLRSENRVWQLKEGILWSIREVIISQINYPDLFKQV